jgi:UDP-N-acetylglucosamine--N-acetylmuramyl-(pentapeptide) pyrophosphoryl-undecaprenol N-acetylglucosamine transferase
VVSGGGTAGHVAPGLALAHELSARGHRVAFVGTDRGIETRLVPAEGFDLTVVPSRPFVRRLSLDAARAPVAAVAAVRRCRPVVRDAAAVVGMGGYASVPAVLAARREHVPVVLHEQNAIPGLANRVLSRVADAVALSYPEAAGRFGGRVRSVLTWNPVRASVLQVLTAREALAGEARSAFGFEEGRRTVVVFGGSLGALSVGRAAAGACRLLAGRTDLQVLVITGPDHLDAVQGGWDERDGAGLLVRMEPYVDRMELPYSVADLVIARAGASTVAEVSALGIPSVLVPYPHAVAGEQEANARALERAGGASVVLDDQLSAAVLAGCVQAMIDHDERLAAMAAGARTFGRSDAAARVADLVESVAATRVRTGRRVR